MIRNKDGQLRKENPEITDKLEGQLAKYKVLMHRGEQMASLKDHPGWIAIQEILQEKISESERKLDGFSQNEHRQNDLLMQERKNFRFFLSIVDDFQATIPKFQQAIENTEKQLNERRKEPAQL